MKILTQNLKSGKTDILNVPSPTTSSKKISVSNIYSLISKGTESSIVNFVLIFSFVFIFSDFF